MKLLMCISYNLAIPLSDKHSEKCLFVCTSWMNEFSKRHAIKRSGNLKLNAGFHLNYCDYSGRKGHFCTKEKRNSNRLSEPGAQTQNLERHQTESEGSKPLPTTIPQLLIQVTWKLTDFPSTTTEIALALSNCC